MNEQIKKLMVEAGIDVEKLRTYSGGWPREDLIILQDFAKLIVLECAEQSLHIGKYNTPSSITPDLAIAIAIGLKKHFGVEE